MTRSIELTFLGTRGEIKVRSRRHRRHSSVLIRNVGACVMIDCGADWLNRIRAIAPTAIVLTHAHRDHAAGLAEGAPCPVYATRATFNLISRYPIDDRRTISLAKTVEIGGVRFKAVAVQHSIRAPAVGYRVSANATSFFYVPDVAKLSNPADALRGVDIYVGDGATVVRSLVRKRNSTLIGHASIAEQLGWCAEARIGRAIFTHCGSPIVRGNARVLNAMVRQLGREQEIDACIACDGDKLVLAAALASRRIS
jgi:ribonuclease BN (tRNA processing enzyme)